MRQQSYPERDVVLVGGGHTHSLVLRKWGMNPPPNIRMTLINPGPYPPYSGMLPGFVAGHYTKDEMVMDLVPLARFSQARLIFDRAIEINTIDNLVLLADRQPIKYDVVSLDVGINAEMPQIDGFLEHGTPVKPFARFVSGWQSALGEMISGAKDPTIVVIGGGVAGVELSLAMHHRLTEADLKPLITIVEQGDHLLSAAHPKTRGYLEEALQNRGIDRQTNAGVAQISPSSVTLTNGKELPSSLTIAAAGARAHNWLAASDLSNKDGYIEVGEDLRAIGHSNVFAVGDCAEFTPDPRPKAGVFAVRQAPILDANLRAVTAGTPLRPYRPQKSFLKLISVGGKDAVAERGNTVLRHPMLWHWKDRIDRKFMQKFIELPQMEAEGVPPLCAGCGAKVGSDLLAEAIAQIPPPANPSILTQPGDDAAVLDRGGMREVLTTDHLRAFTQDTTLMARIAAIHALGDIWAMAAHPETILVTLILPRAHPRIHERMLREVMEGISQVTSSVGAAIVGGHTSEGAELTIGLAATGLCQNPISLADAQPGEVLILTKPIGTGTILAGEMVGKSKGNDVVASYNSMSRPLAAESALLAPHASTMTDVTGFGLAGHLSGMMEASGTAAELDLDQIGFLPGALELAKSGVRSSLYPANAAAAPVAGSREADPRSVLLHDPQTAGGLLAAVPHKDASRLISSLTEAGVPATQIGQVVEKRPDTPLIRIIDGTNL